MSLRVYTDFVVSLLCHCGGKVRFFFDTISMGSDDDDRTFNGDFSEEGVVKLKERVKVKLKEYMGDYTDDILVVYEYFLFRLNVIISFLGLLIDSTR